MDIEWTFWVLGQVALVILGSVPVLWWLNKKFDLLSKLKEWLGRR